ncbi:MAG: hypothetical protein EBS66_17350 [Betaproteobacteria bacterium]|nr:hypothetical protein [Betaproteobacteria bacterium]
MALHRRQTIMPPAVVSSWHFSQEILKTLGGFLQRAALGFDRTHVHLFYSACSDYVIGFSEIQAQGDCPYFSKAIPPVTMIGSGVLKMWAKGKWGL